MHQSTQTRRLLAIPLIELSPSQPWQTSVQKRNQARGPQQRTRHLDKYFISRPTLLTNLRNDSDTLSSRLIPDSRSIPAAGHRRETDNSKYDTKAIPTEKREMSTSATKRLLGELKAYTSSDQNECLEDLAPVDGDLLHWTAIMKGVAGTAYERKFADRYPRNPYHSDTDKLRYLYRRPLASRHQSPR